MSTEEEYVLLLGNIGVGKSAICNALGATFASATQGRAVTTKCSKHKVQLKGKNVILIDAPGLYERDKKKVKQNAEEIHKALLYGGTYRLIFVLTLSGGRLPEGELATMKSIYAAVDRKNAPIGVIINKLHQPEMEMLDNPEEKAYLLESLQSACPGKAGSEACEISLFVIPFDGVGDKCVERPPQKDLTEWLLKLVTAGIDDVREIEISDRMIDDMKAQINALNKRIKERDAQDKESRDKQLKHIEEETRRAYMYGPLQTTVTNQSHLPNRSESNGRALREVKAKFANEEESVEVLVDEEAFERSTAWKWTVQNGVLTAVYAYVGIKSGFSVPLVDWLTSDDNLHINTQKAKGRSCSEVIRVESIVAEKAVVETNEIREWSDVSDNKSPDVESELKYGQTKSTENTFSLMSADEVGFKRLCSAITKFDVSVQSILTGSKDITRQLTSNVTSTTTAQLSAVSRDERLAEVTFKVLPGKSVRITKWRHEKVKTTPFKMTTVYNGQVLLCQPGVRARAIVIPACDLWPANEISWQVTEKEIEIRHECSQLSPAEGE